MAFYLFNKLKGNPMKKLFFIVIIVTMSFPLTKAQAYKDSWSLGFGLSVPRYVGADMGGKDFSFGGHLSLQNDLSEHVAIRAKASYLMLEALKGVTKTDVIGVGLDLLYNFAPCEPVSPYFGVGIAGIYVNNKKVIDVKKDSYLDYQLNLLFGANWTIDTDWKIKTELGYQTVSNNKLDGKYGPVGGLLGGPQDSYMSFELGAIWYFDKGEVSKYCDIYTGITLPEDAKVDYAKIEEIVRKYTSTPASIDYNRIEDIVKKNSGGAKEKIMASGNWVLVGVNFESGKSSLSSESYPILVNAVQVLLSNPDMKVEIQGHTDNIGSESFNRKLSEQRAETVKRFLVAKGVLASRLSTVGVGSSNPVADNKTTEGRSLNRRIEFKVLGK